jgi:hypothetical protein
MIRPATAQGEPAKVEATAARPDTKIKITDQQHATTIDVTCPFGIDRATLKRMGNRWPPGMIVRMHLKGLESFEAASGPTALRVSVPSTGEPGARLSLRQDGKEIEIDRTSPYWTNVQIEDGQGKIPLSDGHFEIPLPARLFDANPKAIELRWVDFYRN